MKLIVFGATGRTGSLLVKQALEEGHTVTVVARRPAALTAQHPQIEVVSADVLDASAVEMPILGQDAVISVLGVATRAPTKMFSVGTANIIRTMKTGGVRRLICVSAGGLDPGPILQRWVARLILQRVYQNSYADMARMEAAVQASELDWTIVCPPMLTNGPRTRKYQTAVNKHLAHGWSISRADLADYIVSHLADRSTYRGRVEIAY